MKKVTYNDKQITFDDLEYKRLDDGYFECMGEDEQGTANAFQAGFNAKAIIGEDIEHLLTEFKITEHENFDGQGKRYTQSIFSDRDAEAMRHLIFKLEEHIRQTDNSDYAF